MAHWESLLERWRSAALLDDAAVERIRAWELSHGRALRQDRLAQLAFALGGLLLAAGVLLFVAAHWDELSPLLRFSLVLLLVGTFHAAAAAVAPQLPGLATTLHAVGTAALGAGIFLAGQIFNMAEHWPAALLLWALGAGAALYLLHDWPHVLWIAVLLPAWLVGEWIELQQPRADSNLTPALAGCTLLAIVYLGARVPGAVFVWRTALARLGAIALVPLAIWLGFSIEWPDSAAEPASGASQVLGWIVALVLPTALAFALRGREGVFAVPAAIWVLLLAFVPTDSEPGELALYVLYALAAAGIVYWGVREQQPLTVNVGVLGFALTIVFFYFASLFDRLGRSLGLIGMGVVLIGGGWLLERTRRRLVGRIGRSPA